MRNFYLIVSFVLLMLTNVAEAATITATSSGNWSSVATWAGGLVPTASDAVVVPAGITVIIDMVATVAGLNVSGTVYGGTSGSLTLNGDLNVASGGVFDSGDGNNGGTGIVVILNGSLTNDGTVQFSYSTSSLTMGEAVVATSISGSGIFSSIRELTINNSKGVSLATPVTVYYTFNLTNGVLTNGANLTISTATLGLGHGTSKSNAVVVRSQSSSLTDPCIVASATYLTYKENSNTAPSQITEGYETGDRSKIFYLTIDNSGGVALADDLTLKSGNTALKLTDGVLSLPSNRTITISSTSASTPIAGGSATSYVEGGGIATTIGTTGKTRYFPIGQGGKYKRVTIEGLTGSSASDVVRVALKNPGPAQAGISSTYMWEITPVSGTPSYTKLGIYFSAEDKVAATNPDVIVQSASSGGTFLPLAAGTNTSAVINTADGSYTNWGYFALGVTSMLPVKLTEFTAALKGNRVQVKWTTASEQNSDRFEVQRSTDGKVFNTIAIVKGQGNSSSSVAYSAYDNNPISGYNYYRLAQVDLDGEVAYYETKAVKISLSDVKISVYPNPTTDIVNIQIADTGGKLVDVILRDLNGRVVYKIKNADVENGCQLGLKNKVSNGLYILEINGESFSRAVKLAVE